MKMSPESIKIIQSLVSRIQSDLAATRQVKLRHDKQEELRNLLNSIPNRDEQNLMVLNFAIASLHEIQGSEPKIDAERCEQNYSSWMNLILE